MDDDELTPDEIEALAGTFPVGPSARTLLRRAKFPAAAIPVAGFNTSADFWWLIADEVSHGVMKNGRRELLTAARRHFPHNPKFAEPPVTDADARRPADGPGRHPAAGPVRVLVIGASPSDSDLPYVRADREAHVIDEVAREDRVTVKAVLGAVATDVEKVRTFRPDILHFVCHGEDGGLVFNDIHGQAHVVDAARIVELLRHYRAEDRVRLRAIVLAACDGQTLAPLFTDVAEVVIGHRGKLADACGEAFARQLYRLLNDPGDPAGPDRIGAAAREAAQLAAQYSDDCVPVIDNLIVLPGSGCHA